MIIKDFNQRKDEALDVAFEVLGKYFPGHPRSWFAGQLSVVDLSISLGFEVEGKLVAVYLMRPLAHPNFDDNLKGLRGDALVVKKEFRGNKIAERFFEFIKNNYDFDYLWGTQDKKLENLNFWLKHRFIVEELANSYCTAQYLRNK